MDVTIACPCPPKDDGPRHPEDTISLRDRLDFHTVLTMRNAITTLESEDMATRSAEALAALTESYVLFGIEAWTLVDAKGKPLPVSKDAIREHVLSDIDLATTVSDAADEMYAKVVLHPLLVRASKSSPPTPTAESTSPTTGSSQKRPKPSKPSSITTIPTAATEATSRSLDGVSSTSPSSTSAA